MNSINWARILAQTVYYFLSYFHVRARLPSANDVEIQYVVPTGNFGDILAGYYAKRMGLPMARLVVATNANDILTRFWRSGAYEKIDSNAAGNVGSGAAENGASDGKQAVGGVRETLSPAMDILVSSNFERLLWYLAYEAAAQGATHEDKVRSACATVDGWMGKMKNDGRVEVPTAVLERARRDFVAEAISDSQVRHQPPFPCVISFQLSLYISDTGDDSRVLSCGTFIRCRSPHSSRTSCSSHCCCSQVSVPL